MIVIRVLVVLLSLGATFLLASSSGETDFVARSINFLIFLAIMYYLLAGKVKEFFNSRSGKIRSRLEEVQERLKQTKKDKEEAQEAVVNAQKIADDIKFPKIK